MPEPVLHPGLKLEYFWEHSWEENWIEMAKELVYAEFNNYKKDMPDTELDGTLTTTVDLVCTTVAL